MGSSKYASPFTMRFACDIIILALIRLEARGWRCQLGLWAMSPDYVMRIDSCRGQLVLTNYPREARRAGGRVARARLERH